MWAKSTVGTFSFTLPTLAHMVEHLTVEVFQALVIKGWLVRFQQVGNYLISIM